MDLLLKSDAFPASPVTLLGGLVNYWGPCLSSIWVVALVMLLWLEKCSGGVIDRRGTNGPIFFCRNDVFSFLFLGGGELGWCVSLLFRWRGVGDNVFSICFPIFFGWWRKQKRISGINLNLESHRRFGGRGGKNLTFRGTLKMTGYPLILEQTLSFRIVT